MERLHVYTPLTCILSPTGGEGRVKEMSANSFY
jgi:hypothetical protein